MDGDQRSAVRNWLAPAALGVAALCVGISVAAGAALGSGGQQVTFVAAPTPAATPERSGKPPPFEVLDICKEDLRRYGDELRNFTVTQVGKHAWVCSAEVVDLLPPVTANRHSIAVADCGDGNFVSGEGTRTRIKSADPCDPSSY